jgi:cobalt-zinc-cadmium resistance protein CzcA
MFDRLLRFALHQRWIVLFVTLAVAALGIYNYFRLPIDAVPDITNVQVQINTEAPGYSPLEAEQRVTLPLESVLGGLPRLKESRSLSRYGLSQITVVFEEGTDIYFARQLVNERLQAARGQLPSGLDPVLGPISTGLGEISQWTVEAEPGTSQGRRVTLRCYGPAHLAGLGSETAVANTARGDGNQQHRGLPEAVSGGAIS